MIRYTLAPQSYDGFGSKTLAILGRYQGRPLRKVEIPPQAALNDWQLNRYWSGGYANWEEVPTWLKLDEAK